MALPRINKIEAAASGSANTSLTQIATATASNVSLTPFFNALRLCSERAFARWSWNGPRTTTTPTARTWQRGPSRPPGAPSATAASSTTTATSFASGVQWLPVLSSES